MLACLTQYGFWPKPSGQKNACQNQVGFVKIRPVDMSERQCYKSVLNDSIDRIIVVLIHNI